MALLEVRDLRTSFYTEEGVIRAVDGVSYSIERGEMFGIVGESGAGKSVLCLSLLRLIDEPGRIDAGEILFKGEDVLEMDKASLRELRGAEMAMVFQDPQTALNPVFTVGEQIAEAVQAHRSVSKAAARDRAIEMLERVGIPDARDRYGDYPHQFSGGMQQRVMIAIALSCDPALVIADEPTTALDVTIEAQILDLLADLASEFDTAVQLISHDLGVIAGICDRVMVMYAGSAVEKAPVEGLYYDPMHPYTVGLMSAIPRIGDSRDRLETIPGRMPDLVDVPPGCRFHPRCPYATEVCTRRDPPLFDAKKGEEVASLSRRHAAACLAYDDGLGPDRPEVDFDVLVDRDDPSPTGSSDGGSDP